MDIDRRVARRVTIVLSIAAASCAEAPRPAPTPARAALPRPPVCAEFSFPVYFDSNSGQLTAAARSVVEDAADRVRGCAVGRVEVLGLADSVGASSANMSVSRRRAEAVAEALARAGLPRPSFSVGAAGASGALSPDGTPEPLRRRAEVVIRASAPPSPPQPR
jgi:outer membrane protein OmpA-like peptidoglycan-associated protein